MGGLGAVGVEGRPEEVQPCVRLHLTARLGLARRARAGVRLTEEQKGGCRCCATSEYLRPAQPATTRMSLDQPCAGTGAVQTMGVVPPRTRLGVVRRWTGALWAMLGGWVGGWV